MSICINKLSSTIQGVPSVSDKLQFDCSVQNKSPNNSSQRGEQNVDIC